MELTGKTLDFPYVATRVVDWLYSKRLPISSGNVEMPIGTRAELQRWRILYSDLFDSAVNVEAVNAARDDGAEEDA